MAISSAVLGGSEPDVDAINLRRVLLRLEQQILLPGPNSRLHSSFERDKVAQNLEYARTLLLRIQHNSPSSKAHARKQAQQAELSRQRALVKRLTERLYELRAQDDDFGDADSEGEDILSQYFAPEPETSKPTQATSTSSSIPVPEPTATSDGIRSRKTQTSSHAQNQSSVKATSTTSASDLFGSTLRSSTFGGPAGELSTEKQLEHQESTQAELTSSLVSLAQQLKASSLAFAQDLALDNETVSKTESSLGKNQEGLESASKRMGVLRKMTEGRWFWQRYIMFILLAVLWVAEIALVFLGPKIRF